MTAPPSRSMSSSFSSPLFRSAHQTSTGIPSAAMTHTARGQRGARRPLWSREGKGRLSRDQGGGQNSGPSAVLFAEEERVLRPDVHGRGGKTQGGQCGKQLGQESSRTRGEEEAEGRLEGRAFGEGKRGDVAAHRAAAEDKGGRAAWLSHGETGMAEVEG